MGLPGPVYDALPDGWGMMLMDRYFKKIGLNSARIGPLERLTYISSHAMGALSFEPCVADMQTSENIPLQQLAQEVQEVLKGEGGEFERNPDAKTLICGIQNGEKYEFELPKLTDNRSPAEEELDLAIFKAVWEGQQNHEYGEIAVPETIGIALYTMGAVNNFDDAMTKAKELWKNRF